MKLNGAPLPDETVKKADIDTDDYIEGEDEGDDPYVFNKFITDEFKFSEFLDAAESINIDPITDKSSKKAKVPPDERRKPKVEIPATLRNTPYYNDYKLVVKNLPLPSKSPPKKSKFIDDDEEHTDDTEFIFPKDKSLKEKLPTLAPVFASMLVKRAFETNGVVIDCDIVMEASNKYRKGQDHIAAFVCEKIVKTGEKKDKIGKVSLYQEFKLWFQQEQGSRKVPKGEELYAYMEKKFGPYKKSGSGWVGLKMVINEEEIDEKDEL